MTLTEYKRETGVTFVSLARRLGIHRNYLYRIVANDTSPAYALALQIEALTDGKVPVSNWWEVLGPDPDDPRRLLVRKVR